MKIQHLSSENNQKSNAFKVAGAATLGTAAVSSGINYLKNSKQIKQDVAKFIHKKGTNEQAMSLYQKFKNADFGEKQISKLAKKINVTDSLKNGLKTGAYFGLGLFASLAIALPLAKLIQNKKAQKEEVKEITNHEKTPVALEKDGEILPLQETTVDKIDSEAEKLKEIIENIEISDDDNSDKENDEE